MASKASTLGDPRRPQEIKKFQRPPPNEDALQPFVMMSMMLGMTALLLRQKIVAWASIFLSLVAFTHGTVESDYRQMMMGISFTMVGLIQSYLAPMRSAAGSA